MAKIIGNLSCFNHRENDWNIFLGRVEQFIKLNSIEEDCKSALLLTHLSDESYKLAQNLVHPLELNSVKYSDLVSVFNQHFKTVKSTFAEKARFYEATRAIGESVEEWAARLRGLAIDGDFGKSLDTVLRDRFVLGFSIGPERDRLFEQNAAELTFTKAIEVAKQAASAREARREAVRPATSSSIKEEPVFRMGRAPGGAGGSGQRQAAYSQSAEPRCSVCGMKNHQALKCRYKNFTCQKCGKKGHLKKVCVKQQLSVHNIEASATGDHSEAYNCKECELFNLRYVNYAPLSIELKIDSKILSMELDSGSSVSVMSYSFYKENYFTKQLKNCNLKMCLYNGHSISPLGFIVLKVYYNNLCKDVKFYVIKNGGPPLVGRDFMYLFNIELKANNNKIGIGSSDSEVQLLLSKYQELWKDELGCFNKFKVDLHLKEGAIPKFFKHRPIPFALKVKVESEIDRLVNLGVLVPVPYSEYATPIVPVVKEDGTVKIAGDFSVTLNKDLYIDKYPMPRIEEVFAKIGGGEHYSKIDLSNAYNQFVLSDKSQSQNLTTISTHKGLFKYTRLVYGLAAAPAIFQRAMEALLVGIEGVSIWLDDLCCTGPDKKTHLDRLEEILRRLKDAGLRLHQSKCSFFQDSVTYLGYVINKKGLHTSPDKVSAIVNMPTPTNVSEVKRFVGMVNYYRSFIPNASELLSPLHELLCDDAEWQWGKRQEAAMRRVIQELQSCRVLAHYQLGAQLVLSVDAGPTGLGAVLSQRVGGTERPIAFASRTLIDSERNYSQIHKEATAIVFGVEKFHQYLYGLSEPFILKTDHKPLLAIFGCKKGIPIMTASRLQRFALLLSAYNYIVQYVSSDKNVVADFFSRAPVPHSRGINNNSINLASCNFIADESLPILFNDIKIATHKDATLQTVYRYMVNGWPRKVTCKQIAPYFNCKIDLQLQEGCILRGHRIVIPNVYKLKMLEELHAGHLGITKTKALARSKLWWPGIDRDIETYIGSCSKCVSVRAAPPRAPPAPWPAARAPWQRLHIDYLSIDSLVYLVVIDAYSKWVECLLMNKGTSTSQLIIKLKSLFTTFGLPDLIISDNDPKIHSEEFTTFCKGYGIKYMTSPIYHPCSNGQAENSVNTCKSMLKKILLENKSKNNINDILLDYLFHFRNLVHCTTGKTPSELMFGRDIKTKLHLILPNKNKIINCEEIDPSRPFDIGELVWVKCFNQKKPYWSLGIICKKLGNRLFEVKIKDNGLSCKRHVDQIFKYTGNQIENDNLSCDIDEHQTASCPLDLGAVADPVPYLLSPPRTLTTATDVESADERQNSHESPKSSADETESNIIVSPADRGGESEQQNPQPATEDVDIANNDDTHTAAPLPRPQRQRRPPERFCDLDFD